MVQVNSFSFSLLLAAIVSTSSYAWSASVRFKTECHCRSSLVRLGDLAEIEADNERQRNRLSQLTLFPSLTSRGYRTIHAREIQDLLALKSIDLKSIRFSGARKIKVYGPRAESSRASKATQEILRLPSQQKSAESRVQQTIINYLKRYVDSRVPWNVEVKLSHSQSRKILSSTGEIKASGGRSPWVGQQSFLLYTNSNSQEQRIIVQCSISHAKLIAVAARSFSKGEILNSSDVIMQPVNREVKSVNFVEDTQAIIGMRTTKAVEAGKPLDSRYLQPPKLVKRGEVITVYVRAPGLEIISSGKAVSDGHLNSVVEVQSLEDRNTRYFTRVVGVQEVEVLVPGVPVKRPASRKTSTNVPRQQFNRLMK